MLKPKGLRCKLLRSHEDFAAVLQDRGHDFWVSALASVGMDEFEERVQSTTVGTTLASDVFTDCYYAWSRNIKADADAVIQRFGLGLRKTRVRSKDLPGTVFVLVNKNGPTQLMEERADLHDTDTRLSAEERLRRTTMQMRSCTLAQMMREGLRNKEFWLTAMTGILDEEDAKKKVVTMTVDGKPSTERFTACLLSQSSNIYGDCTNFTQRCGLGLRRSAVRAKSEPGFLALLMSGTDAGGRPGTDGEPQEKRKKLDRSPPGEPILPLMFGKPTPAARPTAPVAATKPAVPAATAQLAAPPAAPPAAAKPASPTKPVSSVEAEEIYVRQVQVLEKKLASLLPTIPRNELSTDYVQARLEESMQKPPGRLDKFKKDIARVWRRYKEDPVEEVN